MGFAEQMLSSIKNNNRRSRVHIPFKKIENVEQKPPLKFKKQSPISKIEVKQLLKKNQDKEKENLPFKIIATLILTIIIIVGIIYTIKYTFF